MVRAIVINANATSVQAPLCLALLRRRRRQLCQYICMRGRVSDSERSLAQVQYLSPLLTLCARGLHASVKNSVNRLCSVLPAAPAGCPTFCRLAAATSPVAPDPAGAPDPTPERWNSRAAGEAATLQIVPVSTCCPTRVRKKLCVWLLLKRNWFACASVVAHQFSADATGRFSVVDWGLHRHLLDGHID